MDTSSSWSPGSILSDLTSSPSQLQEQSGYQHHPSSPANLIGIPHHFTDGRFSGQTLRAELHEVQRPIYGRRFGAVDRRVLDDPPVVLLRLFNVYNAATDNEWEQEVQNYSDVSLPGLLCMVDLFEFPRAMHAPGPPFLGSIPDLRTAGTSYANMAPDPRYRMGPTDYNLPPDTLAFIDGCPITESCKRTMSLFGTKFVEPHKIGLTSQKNQQQIMFTFSDLAVRLEGYFILRYRVFDIFSNATSYASARTPILAECYGGPFKVYSSKEAPALKESTTLTKRLADHGVPVKIREKPRLPRRSKG